MPVSHYGHEGFWSEGLGIAGALIDMLILNRNGVLEFFPGIAENAAFENLLTEGGYKCSAKRHMGHIADLLITPAQNGICCIRTGWHAAAIVSNGSSSILLPDLSGIIRFKVMANTRYHLDEYLQDKNSCST